VVDRNGTGHERAAAVGWNDEVLWVVDELVAQPRDEHAGVDFDASRGDVVAVDAAADEGGGVVLCGSGCETKGERFVIEVVASPESCGYWE
jgi:hypothetical protein